MATGEMTAAKELNLQARFEQLESGLTEAHAIVDQMTPREEDKGVEAREATASNTGAKCQSLVQDLITRLQNLKDRVGVV